MNGSDKIPSAKGTLGKGNILQNDVDNEPDENLNLIVKRLNRENLGDKKLATMRKAATQRKSSYLTRERK